MTLESGIFLSQAIWLWRVRHIRKEAKKAGQTYDEFIAQHPSKKLDRSSSSSDSSIQDVEAGRHQITRSTETLVQDTDSEKYVRKPETAVIKGQSITGKKEDGMMANSHGEPPEKTSTADDYTG